MTKKFANFDATQIASDAELRTLLDHGNGPERVWAAWRLALRRGQASRGGIESQFLASDDVGARRSLLIVLAGLGERDLLRAMADDEPDPLLRGEAMVLVWRTFEDRGAAAALARGWLATETDPQVLTRLVEMSPPLPAPELWTISASAPHVDVRRSAWRTLVDEFGSEPGFHWDRILAETDDSLRRSISFRWAGACPYTAFLAAGKARPSVSRELLSALNEHGQSYTWDELERLEDLTECTDLVLELLEGPYPKAARLWLFDLLDLEPTEDDEAPYYNYNTAWHHAIRAYWGLSRDQLTQRELDTFARLERAVQRFDAEQDPNAPEFDPYWDPMGNERAFLAATGHDAGRVERYVAWDDEGSD